MPSSDQPPGLDPALLERHRRGVPLRLSRLGSFVLGGDPVTHPRVEHALRCGLDVTEAGEAIVRLGAQWCYLTVDDCPLRVTGISEADGHLVARLDDGRSVDLDLRTLWEEPERGLRCRVPSRPTARLLDARLTNTAQMDLTPWLGLHGDQPVLTIGEHTLAIPTAAPATAASLAR